MVKVYISGSITKDKKYKEHFEKAEEYLKSKGYAVLNPVKNLGFSYKDYIDMSLCELSKCDAIYMLKGWKKSDGANLEYAYADIVGLKIIFEK